jgi:hypothetical protein
MATQFKTARTVSIATRASESAHSLSGIAQGFVRTVHHRLGRCVIAVEPPLTAVLGVLAHERHVPGAPTAMSVKVVIQTPAGTASLGMSLPGTLQRPVCPVRTATGRFSSRIQ